MPFKNFFTYLNLDHPFFFTFLSMVTSMGIKRTEPAYLQQGGIKLRLPDNKSRGLLPDPHPSPLSTVIDAASLLNLSIKDAKLKLVSVYSLVRLTS